MTEIEYVTGDVLDPKYKDRNNLIIHCCNDAGGFGQGVAGAIARKWPYVRKQYISWHSSTLQHRSMQFYRSPFQLGEAQIVGVAGGPAPWTWVANLIGQHDYKRPSDPAGKVYVNYEKLEEAMRHTIDYMSHFNFVVNAPRLGCHLAGGEWSEVSAIIERVYCDSGYDVVVYDLPS